MNPQMQIVDLLTEKQVKSLFKNDINANDMSQLTELVNKKLSELKHKYSPLNTFTDTIAENIIKDLSKYIDILRIEYDGFGLKKNYDRILKIYDLLESNENFKEDFEIVKSIKEDYIKTKKLNKFEMLYLNKIYKEFTIKEEKNEEHKQ